MEARLIRAALVAALLIVSMGARVRTPNFTVDTSDPKLAQQIATAAENYRRQLAIEWLGKAMPDWSRPCRMTVQVGPGLGAGGATTFEFRGGEVFGWRMVIQGSRQRILDSVLPHEITHMIFASHFRRPLPRWADEGGATSVECSGERMKHRKMLVRFLSTGRGIAFNRMFGMKHYPRDIMPLYAQGFSVADFLIQTGGKRKYIAFLGDGLQQGDWSGAIKRHYGIGGAGALQNTWLAWVKRGSPLIKPRRTEPVATPPVTLVADTRTDRRQRPTLYPIYRVPRDQAESYAPGSIVAADAFDRTAVNPPEPEARSDSGWYAAGSRPSAAPAPTAARDPSPPLPAVEQIPSQVTRPQHFQIPRQTILEWCAPGG